jgi:four helix bundle protein
MKYSVKIQRFEDLTVWKKSMALSREVYRLTGDGSFRRDWGLRDQMRRTAISIPSNIAEGFERCSAQELRYLLNVAKGSAGELRTQLMIARDLGYLRDIEGDVLVRSCEEVSRMLARYRKKVNRGN